MVLNESQNVYIFAVTFVTGVTKTYVADCQWLFWL